MAHFEAAIKNDERILHLQKDYSDDEILMELRRRGRLARVEVQNVVPEHHLGKDGVPLDYQVRKAWTEFAGEAARQHMSGKIPSGAKVETVRVDLVELGGSRTGRQVKFVVNYVVERS